MRKIRKSDEEERESETGVERERVKHKGTTERGREM